MYIYISWMPFYTKQTASRLYKTFCVLSKAVNELRLVFFLFFCPAWSKCTASQHRVSSSTGRQILGLSWAPGWRWGGCSGCPQISSPGPSCWRWVASRRAPAAPGSWAGSGSPRAAWMWSLWAPFQSRQREWPPCDWQPVWRASFRHHHLT